MNPNNTNHENFNFPIYSNSQNNSNVGPLDPLILNNPQVKLLYSDLNINRDQLFQVTPL